MLEHGNELLRKVCEEAPATMIYSMRECLGHYETATMICRENIDHAKKHKKKALEARL